MSHFLLCTTFYFLQWYAIGCLFAILSLYNSRLFNLFTAPFFVYIVYLSVYLFTYGVTLYLFTAPTYICSSGAPGYFPDKNNCAYFFLCVGQVYFRMKCPDNLYFNSATTKCDFPYNVNCLATNKITTTISSSTPGVTLGKFSHSFNSSSQICILFFIKLRLTQFYVHESFNW